MAEKITCPACKRLVPITSKGKFRKHKNMSGSTCHMSGETPNLVELVEDVDEIPLPKISLPQDTDYYNGVTCNYNYTEDEDCDHYYCSCRRITRAWCTKIYYSELVRVFCPTADTDYDRYLVDRFLRRTISKEFFHVSIVGGYYGDEIGSLSFHGDSTFFDRVSLFNGLSSRCERLHFVLGLEYGHILPSLREIEEWVVREVPVESITAFEGHMRHVDPDAVEAYELDPAPVIALCLPEGEGRWRLVDGRHRFSSVPKESNKKIKILTPISEPRPSEDLSEAQIRKRALSKLTPLEKRILFS